MCSSSWASACNALSASRSAWVEVGSVTSPGYSTRTTYSEKMDHPRWCRYLRPSLFGFTLRHRRHPVRAGFRHLWYRVVHELFPTRASFQPSDTEVVLRVVGGSFAYPLVFRRERGYGTPTLHEPLMARERQNRHPDTKLSTYYRTFNVLAKPMRWRLRGSWLSPSCTNPLARSASLTCKHSHAKRPKSSGCASVTLLSMILTS